MPDPEAPEQDFGNCSICMEPIVVAQGASSTGDKHQHATESVTPLGAAASGVGHVGSKVMNMNLRRTYALAPCHHLFHTECLSQWLAIKVGFSLNAAFISNTTDAHRYRTLVRFVRGACHHYKRNSSIFRHVSIEHIVSSCTFRIISSISSVVGIFIVTKQQQLPLSRGFINPPSTFLQARSAHIALEAWRRGHRSSCTDEGIEWDTRRVASRILIVRRA
jgi:hypothetical protein